MIGVNKKYQNIPYGLLSDNAVKKQEELMEQKSGHGVNRAVYRHESVKKSLNEIYNNKCAFCESPLGEQANHRVEHFRPINAREKDDPHRGYYWLAYEWSNLLLACDTCNRQKSNCFPVAGNRVTAPPVNRADWLATSAVMQGEQAMLLNPEVDEPADHLSFSAEGKIFANNNSSRGAKTIAICHLHREPLNVVRKKLIDSFRQKLKENVISLADQHKAGRYANPADFCAALDLAFNGIVNEIKNAAKPDQPFSQLGRLINFDPATFLLAGIKEGQQRETVRLAFSRLKLL